MAPRALTCGAGFSLPKCHWLGRCAHGGTRTRSVPSGEGTGAALSPWPGGPCRLTGALSPPGTILPGVSIVNVAHNRSVTLAVCPMEMLAIALSVRTLNLVVTFKRNCLGFRSLKR